MLTTDDIVIGDDKFSPSLGLNSKLSLLDKIRASFNSKSAPPKISFSIKRSSALKRKKLFNFIQIRRYIYVPLPFQVIYYQQMSYQKDQRQYLLQSLGSPPRQMFH